MKKIEILEAQRLTSELPKLGNKDSKLENINSAKEEIVRVQPCTNVFVSANECGEGSIYLTTRRVLFRLDGGKQWKELDYRHVIMHATCTDTEAFTEPCLYLQVEIDKENTLEIRLVPESLEELAKFFQDFSRCASLNPDVDEDFEPEEANEEERENMLKRLDEALTIDSPYESQIVDDTVPNQFDDAED